MANHRPSSRLGEVVETTIPYRLDRLAWSRWHWFVVIALGVTWILDGLEVTLAGAISGVLQKPEALSLTDAEIGPEHSSVLLNFFIRSIQFSS